MSEFETALSVSLDRLDERYGELRIARPRQQDAVTESMRRFGQLTPLVASARGEALAVIDGFKRLHAADKLGLERLAVRLLPLSEQAAVAAVYSLNRHGSGMSDLEEALVVRALCREHAMAQVEVAELLGRHKSWVSRRLMLVERLSEQVQQDVRVGLVSVSVAREVARLPRGNQPEVAMAVHRHGLTARDATHLVSLFEKATDRRQQQNLLERPRESLDRERGRAALAPHDSRLGAGANRLRRLALTALEGASRLSQGLAETSPPSWTEAERSVLTALLRQVLGSVRQLAAGIAAVLDSTEHTDAT
jgi:ParB/RepB/Spo0J family partition protein